MPLPPFQETREFGNNGFFAARINTWQPHRWPGCCETLLCDMPLSDHKPLSGGCSTFVSEERGSLLAISVTHIFAKSQAHANKVNGSRRSRSHCEIFQAKHEHNVLDCKAHPAQWTDGSQCRPVCNAMDCLQRRRSGPCYRILSSTCRCGGSPSPS